MYLFKLGVITMYLSEYLISAFTCAASFYVMTSQVPKLLAVNIPRQSGVLALIYVSFRCQQLVYILQKLLFGILLYWWFHSSSWRAISANKNSLI